MYCHLGVDEVEDELVQTAGPDLIVAALTSPQSAGRVMTDSEERQPSQG